jgi:hypothetical protein
LLPAAARSALTVRLNVGVDVPIDLTSRAIGSTLHAHGQPVRLELKANGSAFVTYSLLAVVST